MHCILLTLFFGTKQRLKPNFPINLGLCGHNKTICTFWKNIHESNNKIKDTAFYQVWCTLFCIENDAEIFPVHYTWKVAEKGFKMAFMINTLVMINSCEIIFEK